MQWWDNLWLNEGFATWMQGKTSQHLHPEWLYSQDIASGLDGVLSQDSHATTRTIRATAETPAEINEMFDGITYEKGGAVIGMVENFLGEEVFRQGVHNYLQAHLYANATAEDFWNAQTTTSHQPVDKIMGSFVTQPGVPIVKIAAQGSGLSVAEDRFFIPPQSGHEPQPVWTLPICFKTTTASQCSLVTPQTHGIAVPTGAALPLYINAASKGYFRTQYTPEQTAAIIGVVETKLTPEERIGFVGDRWALMQAGQGPVGDYLDLALALKNDPNANVMDIALGKVETIDQRIATREDSMRLHAVIRKQFGPLYAAMGGPEKKESNEHSSRRSLLFSLLGFADDPTVLDQALKITTEVFNGGKDADSALSYAAVAMVAKRGSPEFYEAMLKNSKVSTNPAMQEETLSMLTNFSDPALVKRTLDYAVSGEVRNQDSWIMISALLRRPETRAQAWEYVQENWDKVHAQFTASSGQRIVESTGAFCTVAQRDEAQSFFATHKVENSERTLKAAYNASTACIQLRQTQEPKLKAWLDAQQ
jgi:aminopeptidase N